MKKVKWNVVALVILSALSLIFGTISIYNQSYVCGIIGVWASGWCGMSALIMAVS